MTLVALGLLALAVLVWVGRLQKPRPPAAPPQAMSASEARALLGVGSEATAQQIQDAYARLMRMNHPDHGGTHGLAAQINAARDRLLDQ